MTLDGVLIVCAILALAFAVVAVWWLGRLPAQRDRVIVNLRSSDDALRGVLWTERGPWFVIRDAALIAARGGQPTPIDGDVIVHRENIAFVQRL